MPLVLADRVKETTTTTGTGTITLLGAATGFNSFAVIGNGNTTYYTIAGQGTSEWEVGIGTYTSSGTTLSRDTVLASSAGAPTKTNFSAGTKDVFVTYTAARSVNVDGASIDTFGLGAAQGDILYASGTDNFVLLNKNTTATRYLANTGTTNNPQWDQINLTNGVTNTLPVANGGSGRSSVTSGSLLIGAGTSAMTELAGSSPGQAVVWSGTAWTAGSAGAPAPAVNAYVSPATWSKPAGLKQIKVTVVGGGGAGGTYPGPGPIFGAGGGGGGGGAAISWIPGPSIPGPVAVTAGAGTNSFGSFCSATAGTAGGGGPTADGRPGGAGGAGSGATINLVGGGGGAGIIAVRIPAPTQTNIGIGGAGGSSIFGGGAAGVMSVFVPAGTFSVNGNPGNNYGGGGGGGVRIGTATATGGNGANGIVVVEEFY